MEAQRGFCFLDLPGEIRNRIYHFLNAQRPTDRAYLKPVPSKPPTTPIALTQICRLMRAEYRPLFLSTWRTIVSAHDLTPFTQLFFPETHKMHPSLLPIDFVLSAGPVTLQNAIHYRRGVDILPWLRMHSCAHKTPRPGSWFFDLSPYGGPRRGKQFAEWEAQQESYLEVEEAVNWLAEHGNGRWVEDVREGRIGEVRVCGLDSRERVPWVHVLFEGGRAPGYLGVGEVSGNGKTYVDEAGLGSVKLRCLGINIGTK